MLPWLIGGALVYYLGFRKRGKRSSGVIRKQGQYWLYDLDGSTARFKSRKKAVKHARDVGLGYGFQD